MGFILNTYKKIIMAIAITGGSPLSENDSSPGVKNYWIQTDEIASITPATGGPITAFTTDGGTGTWLKFECALSEGDFTSTPSAGSGGIEYVLSANYRIGGLSQSKIDLLDDILKSQRLPIVAEMRDGSFYYLSRNGAAANAGPITSGAGGGGAAAIGSTITFIAQDVEGPAEVTVATDLAAITT